MMDLVSAFLLLTSLASFLLGFLVLFENRNSYLNKLFFLLTVSAGIWSLGLFIIHGPVMLPESEMLGARMAFVGASLLPVCFLFLTLVFPSVNKKPHPLVNGVLTLLGLFFVYLSVGTDLIVNEIVKTSLLGVEVVYGSFYYFFGAFFLGGMIGGFSILLRKYFEASGVEKKQLKWFLIGSVLAFTGGVVTNLFIPLVIQETPFSALGGLFLLFLIFPVFYSITKYGLFNVKVITTELLVFILWFVLLLRMVISEDIEDILLSGLLFLAVFVIGVFLIKSVIKEVYHREKIEKLARQLEASNQQQENLIRFITHQVKGALTKTRNVFSMILEGSYGEISDDIKYVAKESFRADTETVSMIENILQAANFKNGTIEFFKEEVDMKDLVQGVVNDSKRIAEGKGLDFHFKTDPGKDHTVIGDKEKLKHAVNNIIDNAIKYTSEGSVEMSVGVTGDEVAFTVTDTGVGISQSDKKRLFTVGGHGKRSQNINVDSTGYGLYITKAIVEGHNGRIEVDSAGEGKGSRFVMFIPKK